jgi:cyanophycinase-like exopeptidase
LIAIIGSGELSDTMAEAHRTLMARLNAPVVPVFVDTPAGFELNIDQIDQKAVTYFKRNFDLDLTVARYRSVQDEAERVGAAIAAIRRANYIFAGPGSPSYALRTWRDSKVWEAMLARWREGAMLVFASAASLVLGEFAIPVYEIYKSGADVHWLSGLNLLADSRLRIAVIPHWNNHSGDQHDTRYCFMGAPRLTALEAALPDDALVLGVDEYTGVLLDVTEGAASVFGVGEVTLRHRNHQSAYSKGQSITLAEVNARLDAAPEVAVQPSDTSTETGMEAATNADISALQDNVEAALRAGEAETAVSGLIALNLIAGAGLEQGIYNRADLAVQALQHVLPMLTESFARITQAVQSADAFDSERVRLLDLLLYARTELRKAKQWGAADQLRDGLNALGFTLADTPAGTTWQR